MTNYNPFNPVGRYNIENFLYKHKKTILGSTLVLIFLFVILAIFVWNQGKDPVSDNLKARLPGPKYGFGPYGFGLYAPPREILENPPDTL